MKILRSLFLITISIGLSSQLTLGQDSTKQKKKEIFLGVGSASYRGDLGDSYGGGSLLFTLGLKLNTQKRFNGNFNISIGSVTGQELDYTFDASTQTSPNTFFNSSFISFNYAAQFNLINKPKLKIYLSQGIGFIRFQPKDEFSQQLIDQSDTRELSEDYRNLSILLPTQIGFKYTFANGFGIGLQGGILNTMTDYLDNISQWGNKDGNDNVFTGKMLIYVPLSF